MAWAQVMTTGQWEAKGFWVGFPWGSVVKTLSTNAGDVGLIPGSGRSAGEGSDNTPEFLRGKSHGQRSLAGYIPWVTKEPDTT